MQQPTIWVATFDDAECRVFSFNGVPRRLQELPDQRRAGPRKPSFTDRPVRVHARIGEHRSGVAPRTDPDRQLEEKFVAGVVDALTAKAEAGAFDRLIVAAGPRALGAFRSAAPKSLSAKVVREMHGDYVNSPEAQLASVLNEY